MKKDLLFFVSSAIICILLFMLRVTGVGAHVFISIAGVIVMGALTVLTLKECRLSVFDVLMRLAYGVAMITGIVLMVDVNVEAVHKVSAVVFAVLLVVSFVHKAAGKNK
jgi:hypothetical protein